jgi:hypothetical protein
MKLVIKNLIINSYPYKKFYGNENLTKSSG